MPHWSECRGFMDMFSEPMCQNEDKFIQDGNPAIFYIYTLVLFLESHLCNELYGNDDCASDFPANLLYI